MDTTDWTYGSSSYPKVKNILLGDYTLQINLHVDGKITVIHLLVNDYRHTHRTSIVGTWDLPVVQGMCFASLVLESMAYRIRVIEQCKSSNKMLQRVPDCEGL